MGNATPRLKTIGLRPHLFLLYANNVPRTLDSKTLFTNDSLFFH